MIHDTDVEQATGDKLETFGEFQARRIGRNKFELINGGVVVETGSAAKLADIINKALGLD